MNLALILFLLFRVSDLIIAYIAKLFDKYNEHFIYKFNLYHSNPYIPKFLIAFANYDGAHYLKIAHDGYMGHFLQQFFPLFPLLISLFAPLLQNQYFLTGFIIANISFLLGLYFLKKYLEELGQEEKDIRWILFFLLVFPTSFFFGSVYTEGLFFMLITGALYFSQKKQYLLAFIFSFLTPLTRLMGLFLIIPLFGTFLNGQKNFKVLIKNFKLLLVLLSPILGLLAYMTYLFKTVRDPLYFYHVQSYLNTGRTTAHIVLLPQVYYRYLHIFVTASHNFTYFIAVLEFLIFNLFFWVLLYSLWSLWKKDKTKSRLSLIGLNLFSLINIVIPTATGTMTSIPRYALLSLSFFIVIGEIKSTFVKSLILILFLIFHILLLSLFIQGYFIG